MTEAEERAQAVEAASIHSGVGLATSKIAYKAAITAAMEE